MSQLEKLSIVETGVITPVGMNTDMTSASVKAGISAYNYSNYYFGDNAIKLAMVPEDALPEKSEALSNEKLTNRQTRMLKLAHASLNQINADKLTQVPIFLAGPEPIPEGALPIRSKFLEHLKIQTGLDFDIDNSKVFPMGRAAIFYALDSAFEYLETSDKKLALIGGVDTYVDPMVLDFLASDNRIHTEAYQADGFIPGEGAGFILLSAESNPNNSSIFRPGISEEKGHRYSEEPYQGDGLASAVEQAITVAGGPVIEKLFSSLNGESFAAKEYGVSVLRNSDSINEDIKHIHPADCYGDTGGASGALLIALCTVMQSNSCSLCYGSSDDEFRGAVCIV